MEIDGDARAYSVQLLSRHETVNDVVGGKPVEVTWRPLSFTGIGYYGEINDRVHEFGVSGKLIMNALVMYDRETELLWSQFLSQSVQGDLGGHEARNGSAYFDHVRKVERNSHINGCIA